MATSVALPQPFQPVPTSLITAIGMGMSCVPLASPIIEFVFFHKAIRVEMDRLHQDALAVENGTEKDIQAFIDRYIFLRTVYKHYCSAEDEVSFLSNLICRYQKFLCNCLSHVVT